MRKDFILGIKGYYWGTLLFLFLDKVFGIDVRVTGFIYQPGLRNLYYVFCFVCLGLIVWKSNLSFLVGIVESSINITILCLGIMLPIFNVPNEVVYGTGVVEQISLQKVVNFLFSGGICIWSFYGYSMR